mgnify:CR=1 FL=1
MADKKHGFREIRKNASGKDLLPVHGRVNESSGDQNHFASYVWSVEKLKNNYQDVIVLDARTKEEYEKEHLPGAVQANWTDWSIMDVPQDAGNWALLYDNGKLAEIFAQMGIDGKKPVVIYNDPLAGWGEEGRQLWSLRVAGIENSYILNGGLPAWKSHDNPVTSDEVKVQTVKPPLLKRNDKLVATTDYLAKNLGSVNLLDVREDEEFAALKTYGEKASGRIPGARHIWFKDFYHIDGTVLTPAEIRARIERVGFGPEKEIITYCTGGIRSGFVAIVLLIAGYQQVRNYNVSFSAWVGTGQKTDYEVYERLPE